MDSNKVYEIKYISHGDENINSALYIYGIKNDTTARIFNLARNKSSIYKFVNDNYDTIYIRIEYQSVGKNYSSLEYLLIKEYDKNNNYYYPVNLLKNLNINDNIVQFDPETDTLTIDTNNQSSNSTIYYLYRYIFDENINNNKYYVSFDYDGDKRQIIEFQVLLQETPLSSSYTSIINTRDKVSQYIDLSTLNNTYYMMIIRIILINGIVYNNEKCKIKVQVDKQFTSVFDSYNTTQLTQQINTELRNKLYNYNILNDLALEESVNGGVKISPYLEYGTLKFVLSQYRTSNSIYYIENSEDSQILLKGKTYEVTINSSINNKSYIQILYLETSSSDYTTLISASNRKQIITIPSNYYKIFIRIICNNYDIDKAINNDYICIKINPYNQEQYIESSNHIYATNYIDKEDELFNKVALNKTENILTFTLTTDPHCCFTSRDANGLKRIDHARVRQRLAEYVGSDFTCDLGDIFIDVDELDENALILAKYTNLSNDSTVPYIYVQGNHETFGGHTDSNGNSTIALQQSQISNIGLSGKGLSVVRNTLDPMGNYCYFDFPERKVRVCALNSQSNKFSDLQCDFFRKAIITDNTNLYSIIVLCHIPPVNEAKWNGHGATYNNDIMKQILIDYSNTGKILAVIHGHMHWDNLFYYNAFKAPVIGTVSSTLDQSEIGSNAPEMGTASRPARRYGTYSEYAIDTFMIDCNTGDIKIFRFGAGSDRSYTPPQ